MKIRHFTHRSTDCKTVVERSLLLDLQGHNLKFVFAPVIIEYFEQIIVPWEKICCHFADENSTGLPAQKNASFAF